MRRVLTISICLAVLAGMAFGRDLLRERAHRWLNAATGVYPANSALWDDSYGWWTFKADTNPQPDESPRDEPSLPYVSNPVWSNDFSGTMWFTGANYLNATTNNWNSSATSGAVSVWLNYNTGYNIMRAFSSSQAAATDRYFSIFVRGTAGGVTSNSLVLQSILPTAPDQVGTPANSLAPNSWNHVVFVSDGAKWSAYINGISQSLTVLGGSNSGNWFGDIASRTSLTIAMLMYGGSALTSQAYYGGIGDVSIINSVPSSNEVYQLYLDTKGTYGL